MPFIIRFIFFILISSLAVSAAPNKPWIYAESEHFQMLSSTSQSESKRLLADFEEYHQLLQIFFGSPRLAKKRTTIVVFEFDRDFEPYKPKNMAGQTRHIAAYYLENEDEAYIAMVSGPASGWDVKEIVYHEYVHQFFHMMGYDLPLWLDEGLAEVLSTLEIKKNYLEFGRYKEASLQYLSRSGVHISPLSWLFSVKQDSASYQHGLMQAQFYSQSWLLVHYWLCNPELRESYLHFLELWEHSDQTSLEAMEIAFGMDDAQMQAALVNYVKNGKYLIQRIPLKSKPTRINALFRKANEFEIEIGLGNLRARTLNTNDGAVRFIELSDRYPYSPRPFETLGVMAASRGDAVATKKYFEEAISHGSSNSYVHVAYARLELDRIDVESSLDFHLSESTTEALRKSLILAIESNPNHTKSLELLAYLESNTENPKIANIELVQNRVASMRDSRDTLLSLAVIRWKTKDYVTAQAIIDALRSKKSLEGNAKRRLQLLEARLSEVNGS